MYLVMKSNISSFNKISDTLTNEYHIFTENYNSLYFVVWMQ